MNKAHQNDQTRLFAVAHHALLVLTLFLRHSKDLSISFYRLSQILNSGQLLVTEILYRFFLSLYKQITNGKKTLYHTNHITTIALSYSNTLLEKKVPLINRAILVQRYVCWICSSDRRVAFFDLPIVSQWQQ